MMINFINISWPFILSINLMNLCMQFFFFFNDYNKLNITILINLILIIYWMNMSNYNIFMKGYHSMMMMYNLKYMMINTILTEIMFFSSFFYMFFNNSIKLNMNFNFNNIIIINLNFIISLMNTLILSLSSLTASFSFNFLLNNNYKFMMWNKMTIFLSLYFISIQIYEYMNMNFCFNDSNFWSNFYLLTLFHMTHVFIGSMIFILLLKKFFKVTYYNLMKFKTLIWYWHFIDIIWLLIFFLIYI